MLNGGKVNRIPMYLKVKIDGLPRPKGRLGKGPYKQIICRHLCHLFCNYCK